MTPYIAEFVGTMILILLGDGVVANVNLNKSRHERCRCSPDHTCLGSCRTGSRLYLRRGIRRKL